MKKLAKLAALLAAAALLFGAAGCSGDDDDPPAKTLEGIKITADDTVKRQYDVGADLDLTGITVTAEYSDKSEEDVTGKAEFTATYKDEDTDTDKPFDTKTEGIFKVTLTAAYGGKTDSLDPCEITVGDGNPDADLDSIRIDVDEAAVKTEYKQNEAFNLNNLAGITVKAVYKDADGNKTEQDVTSSATFTATHGEGEGKETFDTSLEIGTYEVTLTATFGGETASVTTHIKIVENDSNDDPPPVDPEPTGTTYAWNFQAAGLVSTLDWVGGTVGTNVEKAQLEADGTYESTPAGLTLNLQKGESGILFNKVSPTQSVSGAAISAEASNGSIEPPKENPLTVRVKGPFTAVMLCGSNSSGAGTSRYAYIKVGDDEVAAPSKTSNTMPADGEKLSYTYPGEDEVTVSFGATNYVRIYDIKITTANGDGAGKTAGEVKSSAVLDTTKSETVANKEDPLGLVGAELSVEPQDVVSADFDGNKENIIIKPLKKGSATITVKNGNKEATIEVTVGGTGKITIMGIEPYIDLSKVATVSYFVNWEKDSTVSYAPAVSSDDFGTVTDATFAKNAGAITAAPAVGEGKSGKGYGLLVTTTEQITSTTAVQEIWNVTFTVTPSKKLTLTKIAAKSSCNKTSNYTLSFYKDDAKLAATDGSGNVAEISESVSEVLESGTAYTFKVAFETIPKENKNISATPFSLDNVVLTFLSEE